MRRPEAALPERSTRNPAAVSRAGQAVSVSSHKAPARMYSLRMSDGFHIFGFVLWERRIGNTRRAPTITFGSARQERGDGSWSIVTGVSPRLLEA